jgi:hypothetical protein
MRNPINSSEASDPQPVAAGSLKAFALPAAK